ncbi:MAG: NERD domain-containing protein [Chloroflexi bacterium]|nr:NERD domain-containing protein [Chloroflexota bacterium]
MEVIRAGGQPRGFSPAALGAFLLGCLFVAAGVAAAYLLFTTPLVSSVSSLGRDRVSAPLFGTLAWALAFIIPGSLIVVGLARVLSAVERTLALRARRRSPLASACGRLPADHTVVAGIRLPDHRRLPEIVVGPAGLLICAPLPPVDACRIRGRSWEVRTSAGRWVPVENPLERVSRDADRLRHWLEAEDPGATPRIFPAVLAAGHDVPRTREVAVLSGPQVGPYLSSLTPSRQITPQRRAQLVELLVRQA